MLTVEGHPHAGQPLVLTECGGISYSEKETGSWGYSKARTATELAKRYAELMNALRAIPLFAGFCYTQFADTYQETNGLLHSDRTPKVPLEQIRTATRGPHKYRDEVVEREWRERMLRYQKDNA